MRRSIQLIAIILDFALFCVATKNIQCSYACRTKLRVHRQPRTISAFTWLPNRVKHRNKLDEIYKQSKLSSKKYDQDDYRLGSSEDELVRLTKEEWIGGQEMKQIMALRDEEKIKKKTLAKRRRVSEKLIEDRYLNGSKSRISYIDNTLDIEFPAAGISSSSTAAGAFAALWFGTITPVTVSVLSVGLAPVLFMAPFWVAGAVVAKNALYDPFVSSRLTIGVFSWTVETKFMKRSKSKEGSTKDLKRASVDVAMYVNQNPVYELRLFSSDDDNDFASFARGLDDAELKYLSEVINDHINLTQQSSRCTTLHTK